MMLSEKEKVIQDYFFNKYEDLLWCIVRVGGCVVQSQMCRLLNNNKSDTHTNTILVDDLVQARILRKRRITANNILEVTVCTLNHFGINHPAEINAIRIKLSALVFENYLTQGYYEKENPAMAMRQQMEKSSMLYYLPTGEAHIRQLHRLYEPFVNRGYSTDGLIYQMNRMEIRRQSGYGYASGNKLELPKEPDLFTVSQKNIYLSTVTVRRNEYGSERLTALVDVYFARTWKTSQFVNNLIEAKRVIEDTLQNDSEAIFTIHSHNSANPDFEEKVIKALSQFPEYLTEDEARKAVTFKWYDTSRYIFSNVDPANLI